MKTLSEAALPGLIAFPFELVKDGIEQVNRAILDQARQFEPGLEGYITYVCQTSGKRIRPALALLAGGATGGAHEGHQRLSVVLELVHIASLVHDDIMDGAELRRSVPTAAAKWGSALSVLLGDVLFAHALDLACQFEESTIPRAIAQSARDVCAGEILQTQRRFDLSFTIPEYLRVIEMKTAALFASATELAAVLNHSAPETQQAMRRYGMRLGTAYQIYDDCVDLVGDESSVGKTLGTDLIKGKLTLPMLYLLEGADEAQKAQLSRLLLSGEPKDPSVLAGIADYVGAVRRAVRFAQDMLKDAREDLSCLAPSQEKQALIGLTEYLDGLLEKCRVVS
jgi:octaprenyl-diphosphate synthase